MRRAAVAAFCLSYVVAGQSLFAQATEANARTLLAAVITGQGRPVVDLGLDDFVVTEGGHSREVLDAHVADYPLAVVIDDRAEAGGSGGALRLAARRFIQRVGERPIALFALTRSSAPVTTLDDERATVLERLDAMAVNTAASNSPLETIARAASLLHDSGSPFSGIVVIAAAPVDASAPVRGELLPQVLDSGAVVHVVRGQPSAGIDADPSEPDLLHVIAEQTHGQITPIFSPASYGAALDRLADRLAIEMVVQYLVPTGPRVGDVQVGVRMPGARVVGLGVR